MAWHDTSRLDHFAQHASEILIVATQIGDFPFVLISLVLLECFAHLDLVIDLLGHLVSERYTQIMIEYAIDGSIESETRTAYVLVGQAFIAK